MAQRIDTILMNIDAQDLQDEQDVRFLQVRLARAMNHCGFVDAQDSNLAVS